MTAKIILNPYSGRGKAARALPKVEAGMQRAGVDFELHVTREPLHAVELASSAVEAGHSPIVAAGGDGLIGEVLNGVLRTVEPGAAPPLAVIPLGTANDLVNNLRLPNSIDAAAAAVARGNTRTIDLGRVNGWYFANNSAVGLEPVVTLYNIQMVRLRGVLRYLVAALRAIAAGHAYRMQLTWDDGEYEGPVSLVSVCNNPVTGGLFRMAPAADPTDGQLTFLYGFAPSRLKMLSLLPRTITGSHVEDPALHQHHTKRLQIRADTPTPLQVDGEIRGQELEQVSYEILPGSLTLVDWSEKSSQDS
ncbi:MAG: diacylglycerol kinase family lipid kinase [Anaerolineales bacterium]|nr:diacylglycerol kinase family lipid kinase [Anaerolineales bacterium]